MIFMKRINSLLFELFFLTISLCYIKFFNIGTDTDIQIYYFICSCFYILFFLIFSKKMRSFNLKIIAFSFIFIIIMFLIELFYSNINYLYFRGIYSYISFLYVFLISVNIFRIFEKRKIEKRIKLYYWIWNVVGFIQLFDKYAFTNWTNRVGTNLVRGSISLGSEPFYYAIYLIITSIILYLLDKKNLKYLFYSLIPIFFFANSTQGLLYLIIAILIIMFEKKYFFLYCFIPILLVLLIFFTMPLLEGKRIYFLLTTAFSNPLKLLTKDGSIGIRIVQNFLIFKRGCENFFLPNGFSVWNLYCYENIMFYTDKFLWIKGKRIINISSVYGEILFQLGGLAFIFIFWKFYRISKKNLKIFIIILIFSLNGLNMTFPYFAILISILYSQKNIIK